jgi:hypothetical protein
VIDALRGHPPSPLFAAVFFLYLLPGSLLYFFTNSWVSLAWAHWPTLARLPPAALMRDFMALLRALAPLRALHGYGIFFATTGTPQRLTPVFEGSDDGGRTWRAYSFRVFPSSPTHAPSTVAPHHPRLDHAIFYAAYGSDWHNLAAPLGRSSPHSFSPGGVTQWARLQRALLEGPAARPELHALLARPLPAFAGPGGAPLLVRASLHHFSPATPELLRSTGLWWRVVRLGTFLAPMRLAGGAAASGAGAGAAGDVRGGSTSNDAHSGESGAEGEGDDDEDAAPCGAESFSWDAAVWRRRAQAAGARDCILSKADYELAWGFIGNVRFAAVAAAKRRGAEASVSPLHEACRAMPPAADGAVGVPALQVFDTTHVRDPLPPLPAEACAAPADEPMSLAEADAAFVLGALPDVVAALYGGAALRGTAAPPQHVYTALELRRLRRALACMSLPVLRACERLFSEAPPGEVDLRAEWVAAASAGGAPCATWEEFALLPIMVEGVPRRPGEKAATAPSTAEDVAATATPPSEGAASGGAGATSPGALTRAQRRKHIIKTWNFAREKGAASDAAGTAGAAGGPAGPSVAGAVGPAAGLASDEASGARARAQPSAPAVAPSADPSASVVGPATGSGADSLSPAAITLNGDRYTVTRFAGNDDAGAEGCARSPFRFGMFAHWFLLVGGRRALEALAGGEVALVGRAIAFANAPELADPIALRTRPALLRALSFADGGGAAAAGPAAAQRRVGICNMATEAGLFLLGSASYALFAPSAVSARLLTAQSRHETERPKTSLGPLPGAAELSARLAAHPELARLWGPVERTLLPPLMLPLWVEEASTGGGNVWRHVGWHPRAPPA